MIQVVEAFFKEGKFIPLDPLPETIQDLQRVRITIEVLESKVDVIELLGKVFEGMSEEDIDDVVKIATTRGPFFTGRIADDPDANLS